MARPTPPRRLRKIVAQAEEQGWTYDETGKGHPRLSPPRGARDGEGNLLPPVVFGRTPSDHRGDRNGIAYLRKAGVKIK